MTTREKIEKKGYKVTSNMGWKNGEQTIVSYSAEKDGRNVATRDTITALYQAIK